MCSRTCPRLVPEPLASKKIEPPTSIQKWYLWYVAPLTWLVRKRKLALGKNIQCIGEMIFHLQEAFSRLRANYDGEPIRGKCIVLGRRRRGGLLFFSVQDESEIAQILLKKAEVGEITWRTAISLEVGNSIEFEGQTTLFYLNAENRRDLDGELPNFDNSATILVDQLSVATTSRPNVDRGRRIVGLTSPITQIYLAKMKQRIVAGLTKFDGLVEVDVRLISATPPRPGGVYPLQIHYPGYGAPFFVVPSPIPQLLQIIASTQIEGAFSVSRCFTQGYRDPIVSVESLIVSVVWRGRRVSELLMIADDLLREFIEDDQIFTGAKKIYDRTKTRRFGDLAEAGGAAVAAPEIQVFDPPDGARAVFEVARLCWPRLAANDRDFGEYVIAEGHSSGSEDRPAFSTMTFNIDRLLTLAFEQIELRRIPSIETLIEV